MIMRLLIVLHRYLGVAAGLLMVLWCLSGFVMMYQSYPKLDPADRIEGLKPLSLTADQLRAPAGLDDDDEVAGFHIEMLGDRPVLHLQEGRQPRVFDLTTGKRIKPIGGAEALGVARAFAAAHGVKGEPSDKGRVTVDQWTMDGINKAGPMHHIAYNDPAGTELYVAEKTGQAVQMTTTRLRVLSWLGAIPHWLYPTVLRSNPPLWTQVVIWTSLAGCFLTAFGLYVGVLRLKRYKSGRWSPYRGWFYWHHITGLAFGVLTLTWVLSGMFTMSPWGLFESGAGQAGRALLSATMSGAEVKQFLAAAPALAKGGAMTIDGAPLAGKLYAMVQAPNGAVRRVDLSGADAPLSEAELRAAVARPDAPKLARLVRQTEPDAYYYTGLGHTAVLPAWRADLADKAATSVYIDPVSGRIVRSLDDTGRQSRWWVRGLHDIDFSAALRVRPVWDVLTLVLLAGVTGVCIIGAWLAILRVIIDLRGLFKLRAKPRVRVAAAGE